MTWTGSHGVDRPLHTIYVVGDTSGSGIRGTNASDKSSKAYNIWSSNLVRTGVFQLCAKPVHQPEMTVDRMLEAVKYCMQRALNKQLKRMAVGPTWAIQEMVAESDIKAV